MPTTVTQLLPLTLKRLVRRSQMTPGQITLLQSRHPDIKEQVQILHMREHILKGRSQSSMTR